MPPAGSNKDRPTSDSNRSPPNPGPSIRPNTRRNGPSTLIEEHQDVKDSLEGRKFLEKHSLICPPGEPPTHHLLYTCLHQISAMAGVPKQVVNAIRSVAFMLDEVEDSHINTTLREALDSQMTEFTSDFKLLVEDAKEKFDEHVKTVGKQRTDMAASPPAQSRPLTNTYASALINPPAHANPKVAAREGIKARQFMIQGLDGSKLSYLEASQLKAEFNRTLSELGLTGGKVRSVVKTRSGGTIIEADTDEVAVWLASSMNQGRLCEKLGPKAEFRTREYNVIAFNVPTDINPEEANHRLEICEANGLESTTIGSTKWAKAINRRSLTQRTAHLLLKFDNANAANRAITNGLLICNRKCQVERTRKEPIRCLKCQGWNHFAKDCVEEKDKCGNCAGLHRTSSCTVNERACVSCKTGDHASWSRTCPAFTKRVTDFDVRNPDNSLQFFPTADAWTWSQVEKSTVAPTVRAPVPVPASAVNQARLSKVQLGKRPMQNRRQYDTYIPDYSSMLAIPELDDTAGWFEETRSSRLGPVQVAPSSQPPGPGPSGGAFNNSNNSNENPPMPNA